MTTPALERETFITSRLLEYFSAKELAMQIGHERPLWPIALIKELVDNGLDSCERFDIAPEITVAILDDEIIVEDNGPGLPAEIVTRSLDFSIRVSTNTKYISPTRGQLGNALKTVWGAAYVVGREQGHVEIDTPGIRHVVDIRIDVLSQEPTIRHEQRPPTAPGWTKWKPSSPTSPHWYTDPQLADLIGAYVHLERQRGGEARRSVRDFFNEFRGLTSTAKLKSVAEVAGVHGALLADLCTDDGVDPDAARRMLAAMRAASRPVEAKHLGIIGRARLQARLVESYGVAEASFKYEKIERILADPGVTGTTIPVLLEVAFGVREAGVDDVGGRQVLTGVNWTPTIGDGTFPTLLRALDRANVKADDPVVVVAHLAMPGASFTDRGKHRLAVDVSGVLDPSIEKATRSWTRAKRNRTRMQQAALKQLTEKKERPLSIKDACFQVMEAAYLKASANGTLPAKARQIMYAARPLVMELTGGRFYKSDNQTFQQETLIEFMEEYPDLVADWQVVWDARGHLVEPHGGEEVDLGTLDVRAYVRGWSEGRVPGLGVDLTDGSLFMGSGPAGRYGAILFVEKEGFDELFDRVRLRDRYDIAIMSTKGQSVIAARELLDEAAGVGIPIFTVHDFDKSGMSIAKKLVTSSRRYTYKNEPRVIDLGLRLDDIRGLGLTGFFEPVEFTSDKDPGENLAESGATDAEQRFLVSGGGPGAWTGRRVELNAMTSDQFVAWLERKLDQHGVKKIVPDHSVLDGAYRHAVRLERLTARMQPLVDEIRAEAIDVPADLDTRVASKIAGTPVAWDAAIREIARGERGGIDRRSSK